MTTARIELPPKLIPVFSQPARYRGARGGRISGKSRSFALMTAVRGYAKKEKILCGRELQGSLRTSVHAEIVAAIYEENKDGSYKYPWLVDHYDIGEAYIRGKNGTDYLFKGLRHNYQEIKSTSGVTICWVEEAEAVSEASWRVLIPTIRAKGSEIWVTWNPEVEDSATNKRFIENPPDNSIIVECNWSDNPWFTEENNIERLHDLERDPVLYNHVWEGGFLTRTDAQIFAGKWVIEDFEPDPKTWDGPYFGLDWGFSVDPTAAVKCWINDETLYIEYEAGKVGLELDDVAAFMRERLPGIDKHLVRADNARPESISFVKRNGMPKTIPVKKWKGSVEDGIEHMRSYKRIVIHTRCEETAREFRLYSYKIDKQSEDPLPIVVDLNNHYIDSIRYALEPIIGSALARKKSNKTKPAKEIDAWGRETRGSDSWTTM